MGLNYKFIYILMKAASYARYIKIIYYKYKSQSKLWKYSNFRNKVFMRLNIF